MKFICKSTLLLVLCCLAQFSNAQAPQKMTYQAVIRNASNALITNTSVGMRLSILKGSASGTAVYVETQITTTNANGIITIEVGGGSLVSGSLATINWAQGPYFIKTETDPTGGTNYTISGTSQFLSVPYAFYSKTADSVANAPSLAKVLAKGNDANALKITNLAAPTANQDAATKKYVDDKVATLQGSVSGEAGNFGVYTTNEAQAWSTVTHQWYTSSISGTAKDIIESNGNIGVYSTNEAKAWSSITYQWYSASISGTALGITESNGNIGVYSSNESKAWSSTTNQWYSSSISGTSTGITASNGNIGVYSTNEAKAWSKATNQWYSTSLSGTPIRITSSNGNIAIATSNEVVSWSKDTQQWYHSSLSGTTKEIVGAGSK